MSAPSLDAYADRIAAAGDHLLSNNGASVVLSGSNDKVVQELVIAINEALGNYGNTIMVTPDASLNMFQGKDEAVAGLVKEMNDGKVDALIINGANPSLNMPASLGFDAALEKVKMSLCFAVRPNETSSKTKYVAAQTPYLESWGRRQSNGQPLCIVSASNF